MINIAKKRIFVYLPVFSLLIFCFAVTPVFGGKKKPVTIYENPKPTCRETVFVELKKVGEIKEDLDSEEFLVMPKSLVADDKGNFYVYDGKLGKILKYNKQMKYVTSFSGTGNGPGELGNLLFGRGYATLFMGSGNRIYATGNNIRKVVCFDTEGKLIKEFKLPVGIPTLFSLAVDSKKNFYLHSSQDSILKVYNNNFEKTSALLDRKLLQRGLFYRIKDQQTANGTYYSSYPASIVFDILEKDQLIVFFRYSGFFNILKGEKIIRKGKVWPEMALKWYKKQLKNAIDHEAAMPFCIEFQTDKDDGKSFYQGIGRPMGTGRSYIYHYNMEGKLLRVLFIAEPYKKSRTRLMYKKNGLFYVIGDTEDYNSTIKIYRR